MHACLNYRYVSYILDMYLYLKLVDFTVSAKNVLSLRKKATIHQVTTMLATSINVLFTGHNHLLITSTDDPSLASAQAIIKVSGHQYQWLAGGCDLEIGHFYRWLAWWIPSA